MRNAGVGVPDAPPSPDDGILTAAFGPNGPVAGNDARITDVVTTGNLGAGIDLNSTTGSLVAHSRSVANGIGITVADDLGLPSQDNRITGNGASDDKTGCGIALADHTGAGINRDLVWGNTADRNGLDKGGAGILIATPLGGAPGAPTATMDDNLIAGNEASGNAHAGFELHIHAPGNTITGNRVVWNRFGTNNALSDRQDTSTTGVFLGSDSPMSITVSHDSISGSSAGPTTPAGPHRTAARRAPRSPGCLPSRVRRRPAARGRRAVRWPSPRGSPPHGLRGRTGHRAAVPGPPTART